MLLARRGIIRQSLPRADSPHEGRSDAATIFCITIVVKMERSRELKLRPWGKARPLMQVVQKRRVIK